MKNLFIVILLFISLCLTAQTVPQTIDYQGRLADSNGNYLNEVVTVDFLIYDSETGGTTIWNETQDVNCANGVFHVLLGSTVSFPTDLFDNADRWLELVVSSETLSPRTAIASVPYSLKAGDAHLLDGLNSTDFMPASASIGDITAVSAGTGLYGGGTSGDVTLHADLAGSGGATTISRSDHNHDANYVNEGQASSVSSNMIMNGQVTIADIQDGACLAEILDDDGPGSTLNADLIDGLNSTDFMPATAAIGDITAVNAGTGLDGGGTSGDVILHVDVPLSLTENIFSPGGVIKGINTGTGYGIYGASTSGSGVYGYSSSGNYGYLGSSSAGVYGYNTAVTGAGVRGNSTGGSGGYFTSSYPSSQIRALQAHTTGVGYFDATAIYGRGVPAEAYGFGGYFIGGYKGVYGHVVAVSNSYYYGVSGRASGGYGTNYGVHGWADGTNSTNYSGYFSGNVVVTGIFINPSDERFKENVQPFKNALSKIKLMNVHTFNFMQMEKEKQLVLPEGEQIGLIAQELEEILPELVTDNVHAYDKNEDIEDAERDMEQIEYKGINYIGLIPVLIEAIKEQQEMIEAQQRQIDELLRSAGN